MVTLLGAVAQARPRAVHGRVAAADDDDVVADLERLAEVGELHEVDAVLDALEVLAGDVERDGIHGAGADGDRVELLLELLEGDLAPDPRVETEAHAEPLDEAEVHLDGLPRQAERGHADQHRAAGIGQLVEDGDLVTGHGQLARATARPEGPAPTTATLVSRGVMTGMSSGCPRPRATPRGTASWRGWPAADRCHRGGRRARTARNRRRRTWPRRGSARATGCSPPRTAPRRRGSGSRDSSCRPGRLPGTRCCTGARRRRQAERGIPGWGRWPN